MLLKKVFPFLDECFNIIAEKIILKNLKQASEINYAACDGNISRLLSAVWQNEIRNHKIWRQLRKEKFFLVYSMEKNKLEIIQITISVALSYMFHPSFTTFFYHHQHRQLYSRFLTTTFENRLGNCKFHKGI